MHPHHRSAPAGRSPYTPDDGSPGCALTAAIAMAFCCNPVCGTVAIVLVLVAMAKGASSGDEPRRLVTYAWWTMGIGVAVSVALILVYRLALGGTLPE